MWIWHVSTTTIMNYLPSNLEFKDGVAFIGETSLLDVAKEYGTPLYVYDWEHLRDNIDYFTNAFGEENYFRYAAKAFICKALIKELDGLTTYFLPDHLVGIIWKGKYKGQKQKWFVVRFDGEENEININTKNPEFLDWKWVNIENLTDEIVDFKLHVYNKIQEELKKII